jgi:hypothetical protein
MSYKQVGRLRRVWSLSTLSPAFSTHALVNKSGLNPLLLAIIGIASHFVGTLRWVHLILISSGRQPLKLATMRLPQKPQGSE